MEYVSMVSELNYMSQIVIMLYEDPTKDPTSEERFHVELHFSPGVNCCVQKNLPPGPGFRPHSRNESNTTSLSPVSTCISFNSTYFLVYFTFITVCLVVKKFFTFGTSVVSELRSKHRRFTRIRASQLK